MMSLNRRSFVGAMGAAMLGTRVAGSALAAEASAEKPLWDGGGSSPSRHPTMRS